MTKHRTEQKKFEDRAAAVAALAHYHSVLLPNRRAKRKEKIRRSWDIENAGQRFMTEKLLKPELPVVADLDREAFAQLVALGHLPVDAVYALDHAKGYNRSKEASSKLASTLMGREDVKRRISELHEGSIYAVKGMTLQRTLDALSPEELKKLHPNARTAFIGRLWDLTGLTAAQKVDVVHKDETIPDLKEIASFLQEQLKIKVINGDASPANDDREPVEGVFVATPRGTGEAAECEPVSEREQA